MDIFFLSTLYTMASVPSEQETVHLVSVSCPPSHSDGCQPPSAVLQCVEGRRIFANTVANARSLLN